VQERVTDQGVLPFCSAASRGGDTPHVDGQATAVLVRGVTAARLWAAHADDTASAFERSAAEGTLNGGPLRDHPRVLCSALSDALGRVLVRTWMPGEPLRWSPGHMAVPSGLVMRLACGTCSASLPGVARTSSASCEAKCRIGARCQPCSGCHHVCTIFFVN
jgi:hypothetical protein